MQSRNKNENENEKKIGVRPCYCAAWGNCKMNFLLHKPLFLPLLTLASYLPTIIFIRGMDYLHSANTWVGQLPGYLRIPLLFGIVLSGIVAILISYLSYLSVSRLLSVHLFQSDDYSQIPRPKLSSWLFPLFGHLDAIRAARPAEAHLRWNKSLGTEVYVYRGALYSPRLMLADARAMNYVLGQAHSYEYPKPNQTRKFLLELLGDGLLVAEGKFIKKDHLFLCLLPLPITIS